MSPEQQPPIPDEPMHPCGVPMRIVNSSRWRRVWAQLLAPLPEETADSETEGGDDAAA